MGYRGNKADAEMTFDINFIILIDNRWNPMALPYQWTSF